MLHGSSTFADLRPDLFKLDSLLVFSLKYVSLPFLVPAKVPVHEDQIRYEAKHQEYDYNGQSRRIPQFYRILLADLLILKLHLGPQVNLRIVVENVGELAHQLLVLLAGGFEQGLRHLTVQVIEVY